MAERVRTSRSRGMQATTPMSFRMPAALRSRLRRFAKQRSLGEAAALRLALTERLDQVEDDRELAAAERWQFEQAYATWQEHERSGRVDTVPPEAIYEIFRRALADIPPKRVAK